MHNRRARSTFFQEAGSPAFFPSLASPAGSSHSTFLLHHHIFAGVESGEYFYFSVAQLTTGFDVANLHYTAFQDLDGLKLPDCLDRVRGNKNHV